MRLHYNAECGHQDLPLTPMRAFYVAGRYKETLNEAIRLDKLPLDPPDRLTVNVHEVMAKRALGLKSYEESADRLEELAPLVMEQENPDFIASFKARRIRFAAHAGDYALADTLVYKPNFFAQPVGRTTVTEAHWRLAMGGRDQYKNPKEAIPHYLMVVHILDGAHRPCLREMAARRLAVCVNAQGEPSRPTAADALFNIGLPVSLNPADGQLALEPLLKVPRW